MKESIIKIKDKLVERFGYDTPIFTEDIMSELNEYSQSRVAQLIREMTVAGLISKYIKGVYYFPTMTELGKPSVLGFRQVIEKKYIQDGESVFGYFAGLSLLNSLGLTTQVPNTLEIVTTKESTRVREINIRNSKLILRKARVNITKDNVTLWHYLRR